MLHPVGHWPVVEEDEAWAHAPDGPLLARWYLPIDDAGTHRPLLVHVHGGIWHLSDRTGGDTYCRLLASTGVVAVSVDFRQGPVHHHPAGSVDVRSALRWARLRAPQRAASPDRIGLIGGSSGGHLALLAAVEAAEVMEAAQLPLAGVDGRDDQAAGDVHAAYAVALWPVGDPLARYRYAQRAHLQQIVDGTVAYFADEEAMRRASLPRVLAAGEAGVVPPLLLVQPGDDANVPNELALDLLRAWQSHDGHAEYVYYPGQAHMFGHHESPQTDDLAALIRDFVARFGPR